MAKGDTIHIVKSWAHFFDAIKAGEKTHELRDNDRKYEVGDYMLLQRYDNIRGKYTGEECCVIITYITNRERPCAFSGSVLDPKYCILSIKRV
ncbi:MAG: DUF3850 domain-containing protein [Candidatus Bathyarchaeia archaeon]